MVDFDEEGAGIRATVLGLGNILLGDEGVGIRAIERFRERYDVPEWVEIVDGGTAGIDLLPVLRPGAALIIVDAIKPDRGPGTMLRLEDDEVPAFLSAKLSPHQIGLPDLLATAQLLDRVPSKLILLGIEPKSLETGVRLTPELDEKVDGLVEKIADELRQLGIEALDRRLEPSTSQGKRDLPRIFPS